MFLWRESSNCLRKQTQYNYKRFEFDAENESTTIKSLFALISAGPTQNYHINFGPYDGGSVASRPFVRSVVRNPYAVYVCLKRFLFFTNDNNYTSRVFQLRCVVRLRRGSCVSARDIHRDIVFRQIPWFCQRSGHIGQLLGIDVPAAVPGLSDRLLRLQVHNYKTNPYTMTHLTYTRYYEHTHTHTHFHSYTHRCNIFYNSLNQTQCRIRVIGPKTLVWK